MAAAAYRDGAATAAVRMKDTVKVSNDGGFIAGTPDRRYLWNVQTPQIFERRLYLDALKRAVQEGRDYTDDCQLAEAAGYPVRLVESDYDARRCKRGGKPSAQAGGYAKRDGGGKWVCG